MTGDVIPEGKCEFKACENRKLRVYFFEKAAGTPFTAMKQPYPKT
jgi:hypothetical protein